VSEACCRRRVFLKGLAAAATLPVALTSAGEASLVLAAAAPETLRIYRVIYDRTHPAALAFGRTAALMGYETAAVEDDVTRIWYHILHPRWQRGPAAIIGLTTGSTAFCLEGLGAHFWMRTVFRADHRPREDGTYEHAMIGPASVIARAPLLSAARNWGVGSAQMLLTCPERGEAKHTVTTASPGGLGSGWRRPLVSWVIAPRRI
jgi:hypothetical protein